MRQIFVSPFGEFGFKSHEPCYCGAEDCRFCHPENVRDKRGERDPDQERDEELDRKAEEQAERRRNRG